jgi:hypothetical protein
MTEPGGSGWGGSAEMPLELKERGEVHVGEAPAVVLERVVTPPPS